LSAAVRAKDYIGLVGAQFVPLHHPRCLATHEDRFNRRFDLGIMARRLAQIAMFKALEAPARAPGPARSCLAFSDGRDLQLRV
jgi:hypothetical protein